VRFIHACDIPGVVVRTGVTIIMTFLDSFVRFFVLRLPALLATFVLRHVFINYYGNLRDIFPVVKSMFPPSLLSLAAALTRTRFPA
jgi:hypothetical protein